MLTTPSDRLGSCTVMAWGGTVAVPSGTAVAVGTVSGAPSVFEAGSIAASEAKGGQG